MRNKKVRFIVDAALIAAIYAALTMALWEISSLGIQFRLSEALCVLPAFTPAAIPGLFIGCALANLLGGTWIDVVFGSLATLLAAICSYLIGKVFKVGKEDKLKIGALILVPLPPVLFNAAIIPFVLYYGYGLTSAFNHEGTFVVLCFHALTVGLGELAVCYILGIPFMIAVNRLRKQLKFSNE